MRLKTSVLSFLFSVILLAWLATPVARGQILRLSNTTTTPAPGSGHDYIQALSDTVNPANGSVSLRIQVPLPAGRGLSLPFYIAYDSNGISYATPSPTYPGTLMWSGNASFLTQGGWTYTVPMESQADVVETANPYPPPPTTTRET
jgi:hypothetical protein